MKKSPTQKDVYWSRDSCAMVWLPEVAVALSVLKPICLALAVTDRWKE
jgi:hypothetical protein